MAQFCIPKYLVQKLKDSALKGEVNVKELYNMTSAERRAFFTKHTDPELGKFINTEFEKAMVSKQKTAMVDWAKGVFDPKAQEKPTFKNIIDKIRGLDEIGVLDPKSEKAFLEDLVSEKLGVSVSPQEIKNIAERARKIDMAQLKLGDDIGNPSKVTENIDFFKAKKEMDDYLLSLNPANRLKVLTGTIGRGMMLASVKSPLLNIGSNIELGLMEAMKRRIATGAVKGASNDLAIEYVKMARKVYKETGYDLSRMVSLSDTGASGARVLGDTVHSQGAGGVRAVGKWVEDKVFKQLMGAPDAAFASAHFADSVNLNALKMAKGDTKAAKEIMRDAMRIKPQTPAGESLRNQGILDAQVATWTNKTWASQVSEGIRKILNNVSGDIRAGDYLLPFVKTPANVVATGFDYAGGSMIKVLYKTAKAMETGKVGSREYFADISEDLVRAGLGLTGAAVIASRLDNDDFVGAYDPARAQIEQLRNTNYNAIRIGNKWVSVDWLGALAIPVTAMMYARKYGDTPKEQAFQYSKEVLNSWRKLPGIKDFYDAKEPSKNQTLNEAATDAQNSVMGEVYSRLVPSFLGDIAKATDPFERKTEKGFSSLQSQIPGLRQKLPIKQNIFSEDLKGESPAVDVLFGARVKTDRSNDLINELNRVATANDKGVSFTDWGKSGSATLVQFKDRVGVDKFNEAKKAYGEELKKEIERIMAKTEYKDASDEDKLKMLNNADTAAQNKVFARYNFKYQKPKN